ncbi:M48 family metalloprotease [Natrialba sp. INN-245]|uniref:M48 family metalloprotease n=1 Tax=Natrialba sp. INN-245 TaxID=2690967 RepID=UPI001311E0E5|nr:M48 family metalloprotease [Natrialba sp. INN-245]MWV41398.1 M48 family metalloprotease [Natrialba sp. INN-245]
MTLRLRICAVLGVFVAVNALFVFVLLWAYGVLLPAVVGGTVTFLQHGEVGISLLQSPVSPGLYLALVAAFLVAQLSYGYRRVLSGTTGSAGDTDHGVARIVRRLAMTADVPNPDVRVVEDERASCYTVGRLTDATIVVTTGLIDRLDAAELEAVLAHEIAHVANRDVTLMTIATLFLEVADRAYHATQLVRRALSDPDELSTRGRMALLWFLPLVALTYVFVSPLLWAFPAVADRTTRTLSHTREFAADAAAARITGNPMALATALLSLADASPSPGTDLRTAKTRALCVVPSDLVAGDETDAIPTIDRPDDEPARRERVSAWLAGATPSNPTDTDAVGTHPPLERRLERLQGIAAEQELGGTP